MDGAAVNNPRNIDGGTIYNIPGIMDGVTGKERSIMGLKL